MADFNLICRSAAFFLHDGASAAVRERDVQRIPRFDLAAAPNDVALRVANHAVAARQHLLRVKVLQVLFHALQPHDVPFQNTLHTALQAALHLGLARCKPC